MDRNNNILEGDEIKVDRKDVDLEKALVVFRSNTFENEEERLLQPAHDAMTAQEGRVPKRKRGSASATRSELVARPSAMDAGTHFLLNLRDMGQLAEECYFTKSILAALSDRVSAWSLRTKLANSKLKGRLGEAEIAAVESRSSSIKNPNVGNGIEVEIRISKTLIKPSAHGLHHEHVLLWNLAVPFLVAALQRKLDDDRNERETRMLPLRRKVEALERKQVEGLLQRKEESPECRELLDALDTTSIERVVAKETG